MNEEPMQAAPDQPAATAVSPGLKTWKKPPPWTEAQKEILGLIMERYRKNKSFQWEKAFEENPTWREILLADGRPYFHLWHISKSLLMGVIPDSVYSAKKLHAKARGPYKKKSPVTAPGYWKNRVHPASKEAREARAAAREKEALRIKWKEEKRAAKLAKLNHIAPPPPKLEEPLPVAPIRHCPECGCNLTPYNRAKELTHGQ